MEIIFTKEPFYLQLWDEFISKNNIGSHLVLSSWLHSYQSYGFDYEICLALENANIIGGYGAIISKFLFFKFYIVPIGPQINSENQAVLKKLIDAIPVRAKKMRCCYCQINYPYSENKIGNHHLYNLKNEFLFTDFSKGELFKYVYSSNGLNWIDLKNYTNPDEILADFKTSVRRDIRSSLRKNQVVKYLKTTDEIKLGYDLCLLNAKNANYSIRDWKSFKPTLLNLIKNNQAKFIAVFYKNDIKGALLLIKAGNFYTYIIGGTKKEKPDLLTGHLLQWEAINLSIAENCDGYNISLGGSDGVQQFKNSFNTKTILYQDSKYYLILNSVVFNFFLSFEKKIKPLKKYIAKILFFIKN